MLKVPFLGAAIALSLLLSCSKQEPLPNVVLEYYCSTRNGEPTTMLYVKNAQTAELYYYYDTLRVELNEQEQQALLSSVKQVEWKESAWDVEFEEGFETVAKLSNDGIVTLRRSFGNEKAPGAVTSLMTTLNSIAKRIRHDHTAQQEQASKKQPA